MLDSMLTCFTRLRSVAVAGVGSNEDGFDLRRRLEPLETLSAPTCADGTLTSYPHSAADINGVLIRERGFRELALDTVSASLGGSSGSEPPRLLASFDLPLLAEAVSAC
mmetsp:Transcript_30429/g.72524  ORF Transcript_30429/g.72524 Transcript_30429/m.72524 type:complete len:109 (+) Transcript_30429:2754-3080(+)